MADVALLAERAESTPAAALAAGGRSPAAARGETTLKLVELLLKDPGRLQQLNRDPRRQGELVPRFLLIAVAGYLVYSCTMVLLLNVAPAADPGPVPLPLPPARWGAARRWLCRWRTRSASCWQVACACRASTSTACWPGCGSPGCRSSG